MEKLKEYLQNNIEKICILFLFLQPILDVATAIVLHIWKIDLTIGMIFRILFLIGMLFYLFFLNKSKEKKRKIWYIVIIFLYSGLYLINIMKTKGLDVIFYEGKNLIKAFYFPILLVTLYELYQEKKIKIPIKYFYDLFFIYSFFIVVPNLLKIGFDSYEITKGGSIGFFYSANEIGAILSILMPIFFYYTYKLKNIWLKLLSFLFLLYILTSIGTKGPLLCFVLILLFFIIYQGKQYVKEKKYRKLTIGCLCLLTIFSLGIYLLPRTNFYKNIVVHLEFLEVKNISDIITNPKVFDHFVFSERLKFWNNTKKIYDKAPLSSKLLGIGYIDYYATDEVSLKMVEMDYVDLFYRHGVLGFVIFMSSLITFLWKIIKKYKKRKTTGLAKCVLLSIIFSLVLSFFTGHILIAPAVSIYVAFLMNLFYTDDIKE